MKISEWQFNLLVTVEFLGGLFFLPMFPVFFSVLYGDRKQRERIWYGDHFLKRIMNFLFFSRPNRDKLVPASQSL